MDSIAGLDYSVFRMVNEGWVNPFFDWLMPILSGNPLFKPGVAALVALFAWKGSRRGRCFILILGLTLALGETGTGKLKRAFNRPRPFATHPETRMLSGKGLNASMPSGHAAIWAGAAMVTALYYRRSWRFMVPLAFSVGVSRMYVGVHYPTDVLAGWCWGTFYGWSLPRLYDWLWRTVGARLFPLWLARLPSLLPAGMNAQTSRLAESPDELNAHWRRLSYLTLGVLLLARIGYLASSVVELSEDEAYQWLWSKHPDLSYYSKPPFISYAQWIGTHIAGDTEWGVRFLSPWISFFTGLALVRFLSRFTGWKTAFWFVVALNSMPLVVAGAVLMTIDPLTVGFFTLSMLAGWRAIRDDSTRWWAITGVGFAGAFLSKYFSPFQWAGFALFFLVSPQARKQLRRPGPWLALGINAVATVPVLLWNANHDWITFTHLQERGGLKQEWTYESKFMVDFLATVPVLVNPVFFIAILWAIIGFWTSRPQKERGETETFETRRNAMAYCLAMGLPVLLFYFAYTIRARVQPNWPAAAFPALGLFAVLWWNQRHREGSKTGLRLLVTGVAIGFPLCVILHETNLVLKITGHPLPEKYEPHKRVRGYKEAAAAVEEQRKLLSAEGHPVIVIADHYGWTGLLNFYIPEARTALTAKAPIVTVVESQHPSNQIWFWPEFRYSKRPGTTVLFVQEEGRAEPDLAAWRARYESVTDLGVKDIHYRGRVFHQLHMYAMRNQR